jgi:hypothetical protein
MKKPALILAFALAGLTATFGQISQPGGGAFA